MQTGKKNQLAQILLWICEGMLVGFGAILPGLSGGALLAAFGLYRPVIEVLSTPIQGIKKHWFMLMFVGVGGVVGVVGLAGLADWLLELNATVVYCVFAGLVLGTVPGLYKDAGERGRNRASFLSMGIGFAVILAILVWLRFGIAFAIEAGFVGYLICGVLWGLSFIVPGLSSSNLIMFFGLYEPMMKGIKNLDFSVILPMGLTMVLCLLGLSQVMKRLLDKHYSVVLHGVLGTVLATSVMILPSFPPTLPNILVAIVAVAGGALTSYFFTLLCSNIKAKYEGVEI
jgi:putative membrane protein